MHLSILSQVLAYLFSYSVFNYSSDLFGLKILVFFVSNRLKIIHIGSYRALVIAVIDLIRIHQCHRHYRRSGHLRHLEASCFKWLNDISVILLVTTFREENEFSAPSDFPGHLQRSLDHR